MREEIKNPKLSPLIKSLRALSDAKGEAISPLEIASSPRCAGAPRNDTQGFYKILKFQLSIFKIGLALFLLLTTFSRAHAADLEAVLEDSLGASGMNVKAANGTSRMFVTSNGNVGIGTVYPDASLHVNGKLLVDYWSESLFRSGETYLYIRPVTVDDTTGYIKLGGWDNTGGMGPRNLVLSEEGGLVGIGMTSPTAKLDVVGGAGYDQFRLRTSFTPTGTADANGHTGDVAWDNNFVYIKTSGGWKRAALAAF